MEPAAPLPEELVEHPPESPVDLGGPIDPKRDGEWLRRLTSAPIVRFKRNKGGSTITIKAYFADGKKAAFKPEQKRSATNYRSEIAAYHVDRLVGFRRTAPVAGRRVGLENLRAHLVHEGADADWLKRFDDEVIERDGRVRGALIAWHDKPLRRLPPPAGWLRHLALDGPDAPLELSSRLEAWTQMLVFDHLIDNFDRWSGGNILSLGEGGPLIFLDNGAGFADYHRKHSVVPPKKLAAVCRFPTSLLEALQRVAPAERRPLSRLLERNLAHDPTAPVLEATDLKLVDARLDSVLQHAERCAARSGGDAGEAGTPSDAGSRDSSDAAAQKR